MATLKEKVRKYLNESGLTQKELAQLAGLHPQALSNIVNGIKIPGRKVIRRLVKASGGQLTALDFRPDWADMINP
jgi:transcriptional regulator with XRE-family HTH domain